jgi:hypothetical protein
MVDDARISRIVETDLELDDLWSLVADGEAWAEWMVDDDDIEVDPGAVGTVVDDGIARDVRIDRVEPRRSVAFTWWPQARPDQTSTVELLVVPARTGSRLHVTETYVATSSALRWDVRAMLLVARASFARA